MKQEMNISRFNMPTTLAGLLNRGKIGAERKFKLSNAPRLGFLEFEICIRNGGAIALSKDQVISSQYIIQQMAFNYGQIIRSTTESMSGYFTKANMAILLSINESPIWQTNVYETPLEMISKHYELEKERKIVNSELNCLLEKLQGLSFIENLTLIDICEQFWRNKRPGTLEDNLKHLNLNLS